MDQTQTVDDDLQKAIDNITNSTNVDPVFSDPVAAPSTIPEGDTGELSEPVGPFPETPKVQMVSPVPEPIAPLESVNIPELNMPPLPPEPDEVQPLQEAPTTSESSLPDLSSIEKLNTSEVKKSALRDLIPLLNHLSIDTQQRFNLYKNIFEELRDYTVLEPAYKAAREIADETKRAEALLYLVESIDKM